MQRLEARYRKLNDTKKDALQLAAYVTVSLFALAVGWLLFRIQGKSWVWAQDGVQEYLPKTLYIGRWLRALFSGAAMYDFTLGLGGDAITYNSIWFYDPLALPLVFAGTGSYNALYDLSLALRFLLSGLSALALFRYLRLGSRPARLSAALIYEFCTFTLCKVMNHPNFALPMVGFPLLVLALERLIRQGKWLGFSAMVAVLAVSSLYFFYMCVILIVLYYLVRCAPMLWRGQAPAFLRQTLKVIGFAALGLCLSGALLVPNALTILASSRSSGLHFSTASPWYYSRSRLPLLITAFVMPMGTAAFDTSLGFLPLAFFAAVLAFTRGGRGKIRALLILALVMCLIPACSLALNAFSYVSGRWTFGIALAVSAAVAADFDRLSALSRRQLALLTAAAAGHCLVCGFAVVRLHTSKICLLTAGCLLLTLAGLWLARLQRPFTARLLLCALTACFALAAFARYLPACTDSIQDYLPIDQVPGIAAQNNLRDAEAHIEDSSFHRIAQLNPRPSSAAMLAGYFGVTAYDDMPSRHAEAYAQSLALSRSTVNVQLGFNERTAPTALNGVKYYVLDETESAGALPYGFVSDGEYLSDGHTLRIFRNENALPLGYTYDRWVGDDALADASPALRQETMLRAAIVSGGAVAGGEVPPAKSFEIQPTSVTCRGCALEDGRIRVEEAGACIAFTFDAVPDSEYYLFVQGFDVTPAGPNVDVAIAASSELRTSYFRARSIGAARGARQPDALLNLGYSERGLTGCTLTFDKPGTFALSGVQVCCQPMADFAGAIDALRREVLQDVVIDGNAVSGTIETDGERLLCLSIPYSTGWRASVDGLPAELLRVNYNNLGLLLGKGRHDIRLTYRTPGLTAGLGLSLAGLAAAAALLALERRRGRIV